MLLYIHIDQTCIYNYKKHNHKQHNIYIDIISKTQTKQTDNIYRRHPKRQDKHIENITISNTHTQQNNT